MNGFKLKRTIQAKSVSVVYPYCEYCVSGPGDRNKGNNSIFAWMYVYEYLKNFHGVFK